MATSSDDFKQIMRNYASGVTIVTARDGAGLPVGATVSAFSSVSVDPPLVLICLHALSRSARAIRETGAFTVHILDQDQIELASRFAGDLQEKFDVTGYVPGKLGAPSLTECANQLECSLYSETEAGTHHIFVGRVEHITATEVSPLLYVNRQFCGIQAIERRVAKV